MILDSAVSDSIIYLAAVCDLKLIYLARLALAGGKETWSQLSSILTGATKCIKRTLHVYIRMTCTAR